MPVWSWILIAVGAAALCAAALWVLMARQRTSRLRERFGPEYDRAVESRGSFGEAESELVAREKRREQFDIKPLPPATRERYLVSWREVQTQFVDDPRGSIASADSLIGSVMRERGYPVEDFEQRAADLSVDHPAVVENYRSAHAISEASDRGDATTEDLRLAMQHYRSLFEDLLEPAADEPTTREAAAVGEARVTDQERVVR